MTWIDERGRVFGKVNLIDGFVFLFICLLIPLTYGAYMLFRPPAVTIAQLEPSVVPVGQDTRITIHGQNLRPYLRAFAGSHPVTYRSQYPERAELQVSPSLPAGDYPLTLYDETELVLLLPHALTVVSPVVAGPVSQPVVLQVRFVVPVGFHIVDGDRDDATAILGPCAAPLPDRVRITRSLGTLAVEESMRQIPCRVSLHLVDRQYRGSTVKPGAAFAFLGQAGEIHGWIDTVTEGP